MSGGKRITLWTISILLACLFLFSGAFKLLIPEKVRPGFVQYGYAPWFATVIGIGEVLGAIGLLVPPVALLACTGLSVIMIGAFFTHVTHHEFSHATVPLLLLFILIAVAYGRQSDRQRLH
jgi:uncharacterized membrane protein YphA (DoxX/SURF4 family)